MLRIRPIILIVLQLSALQVFSQTLDDSAPAKSNKVIEFGITGFNFRGYDFSKDFNGSRDRYCLSGSPGFVFSYGSNQKQFRIRAIYNEVTANGALRARTFAIWFDRYGNSLMQYYRQEAELRMGYLLTSNANSKSSVHLYMGGDIFYAFGRHKYAVVYNDAGGFGEIIGYSYNSIGILQTIGLKFKLRANFTLLAETGFAIESVFGKKNYNDPSIDYFFRSSTLGANMRMLQLSLTKRIQ